MRKVLYFVVVCCMIALTACAQNTKKENQKENKPMGNDKVLVVYFSASGTTAKVAKQLAAVAKADIQEIKAEKKYTAADLDWENKQSRSSVEMNDSSSRPAIVKDLKNLKDYSTIYVGFPIWWGTAPRVINTFFESYDFTGKTVILFATSGGSGVEESLNDLEAKYPNINFKGAKLLNGVSDDELGAWVNEQK